MLQVITMAKLQINLYGCKTIKEYTHDLKLINPSTLSAYFKFNKLKLTEIWSRILIFLATGDNALKLVRAIEKDNKLLYLIYSSCAVNMKVNFARI